MPISILPPTDFRLLLAGYKSFVIWALLEVSGLILLAAGCWAEELQAGALGDKLVFYGMAVVIIGLMIMRRPPI